MPPSGAEAARERRRDRRHGGTARRQQRVDLGVGIEHRHAEGAEAIGGTALAHGDRAGQPEQDHAASTPWSRRNCSSGSSGRPSTVGVVALDPRHQLRAQALELVGADAAEDRLAGRSQIVRRGRRRRTAARRGPRASTWCQTRLPPRNATTRADQPVSPAAQPEQLGARGRAVGGLLEPLALELEELVGAEDDRLGGRARRDVGGLHLGQRHGRVLGRHSLGAQRVAQARPRRPGPGPR